MKNFHPSLDANSCGSRGEDRAKSHKFSRLHCMILVQCIGTHGFPRWHWWKKNLLANSGDVRDVGLIPGSRRSPGGGDGNPLQYSCLENPMDRGAW